MKKYPRASALRFPREVGRRCLPFPALVLCLLAAISGAPARAQTLQVGPNASTILFDPVTDKYYVGSSPLSVIDGAANTISTIPQAGYSTAYALNPVTNKLYYLSGSGTGGADLTVVDLATNAVSSVPVDIAAYALAVNTATNKIYVANFNSPGTVTVIDGATNATTTVTAGFQNVDLAVNSATNKIYVANYEAPVPTVTVIDGATNAVTNLTVPAALVNNGTGSLLAVNTATNKIYLGSNPAAVIDGATNTVTKLGAVLGNFYITGFGYNPVTNMLYIATSATGNNAATTPGTVTAMNGITGATTAITVGILPSAIAVNTATNTIMVANHSSNNVTEINGATNAATNVSAGNLPSGIAVNPATNQFYVLNAGDNTVSVIAGPAGTPVTPPAISSSPQSQSVSAGQSVTFTGAAAGTSTYQWLFNGAAISGATNATLTLNNVTAASAGTYTFVATNGGGSVTASANLAVAAVSAPAFTTQPVSQTVVSGTTVVFNSAASGSPTPTFQWKLNGTAVPNATSARLVIADATAAANAGSYTCVATNSQGPTTSSTATLGFVTTPNVGRLVNLSVNTTAGKSQVLTVGFVTGGAGATGSQTLLLRATGPALAALGVQNVLADPTLTVFSGQTVVTSNDNWGTPSGNQATITTADNATGAFALTNPASLDAALVDALAAGGYTVQVSGNTAAPGTTLAEVYDYTPANTYTLATPRLINISSNNQIAANGSMTAGFVIGGTTSKTVLIRATGPALAMLGVQGTMPDPQLALHTTINNQDTVLASNAGWGGDPQIATVSAAVGAFALTSATSKDSVVLVTLPPGDYTAVASSVTGTAGIALIEVYEVP